MFIASQLRRARRCNRKAGRGRCPRPRRPDVDDAHRDQGHPGRSTDHRGEREGRRAVPDILRLLGGPTVIRWRLLLALGLDIPFGEITLRPDRFLPLAPAPIGARRVVAVNGLDEVAVLPGVYEVRPSAGPATWSIGGGRRRACLRRGESSTPTTTWWRSATAFSTPPPSSTLIGRCQLAGCVPDRCDRSGLSKNLKPNSPNTVRLDFRGPTDLCWD